MGEEGGRGGGERRGGEEGGAREIVPTLHKSIKTLPVSCCKTFSVKCFTSKRQILPNTNHRFLFLFLSVISFSLFFLRKSKVKVVVLVLQRICRGEGW